jgi:16S rRNA (cytosine967-C5)-methyltransferase
LIAHLAGGNLKSQVPNLKVLDFCAAPGSKTGLLASLLSPDSIVVAGDLHLHRLRTMRELNARLGLDQINLVQLDATQESPFEPESFDVVLLDGPCSGLGTLQRHPEIKWRTTEAKIPELAELQKRLLSNAARQLRAGGLLVYSVCSTELEEAEQIIEWFRAENSGFRDMTRERLAELGIDPLLLLTASHGARTFTHRQVTESFFFCVLWKRK